MRALILALIFTVHSVQASPGISLEKFKSFNPVIRVKLAEKLKNFFVSGMDLSREIIVNNQKKSFSGLKAIRFNCEGLIKEQLGIEKPILLASINSPTGYLNFEKERYRGSLSVALSRDGNTCELINETNIEDYISSLLSKEMNASWPIEALKAQAVAARTYALYKVKSQQVSKNYGHNVFYDLESSEKHQVSGGLFDTTPSTDQAAKETEGEILHNGKGEITPIFFHAMCGGGTLRPDQVWSNAVQGYDNVPCPGCNERKNKLWNRSITMERMQKFLEWGKEKGEFKFVVPRLKGKTIRIPDINFSNTYIRIYVDDQILLIKKTLFRKFFGRVEIPSNFFKLKYNGRQFLLDGNGHGHGVGLCQIGALDLAKKGWDYKRILKHYLPGFEIRKIY
ncbi:MAG: SpoIID/LytB domain-containing protein [Bdellovibrio sp.]